MTLTDPRWLAALPLVVAVVWLGRRFGAARRLATWVRAVAVVLVVLALAGPRVAVPGGGVDVAFLVDASDSVGPLGQQAAARYVTAALRARGQTDRAALARFGRDARVEHGLSASAPPLTARTAVVDPTATDLGRAVRLAEGVLGGAQRRRIVLLTDGRQTHGDLLSTAQQLAEARIALDVVTLPDAAVTDVLVEEVRAPARVRQGEAYDVVTSLRNTSDAPAPAVLSLLADGAEIDRQTVAVPPGESIARVVAQTAEAPGTVRYEARISSGASTIDANDVGRAAVQIAGPPRVLVYQRTAGLGEDLARALGSAGVPTDVHAADTTPLPSLDALLGYDSVVLVDVPAVALGEHGMTTLDQFVRDAGHGLVAVGGSDSFGVGGYGGTPLERLLPVSARITAPLRRPSIAEALVVDVSDSMGTGHRGGADQTDIAKEAIVRAVKELEPTDQIGVLAFNTSSEWLIPVQRLPADAVIDEGLARLHPHGGTDVPQAVREAIAKLENVDARLRHIVVFTDGLTVDTSGLDQVAHEAAAAGITLSVVETGEGSLGLLRQMAAAGGGRYYAGRSLSEIPDIVAVELEQVTRPIVNEGEFYPTVVGRTPATEALDTSPPLAGYLATTAKPTAQTFLKVGPDHDPLLTQWQVGLGTTVAWTSDVARRWSARWVGWDRFSAFWADVVKETFPKRSEPGFELSATATTEGLRVAVTLADGTDVRDVEVLATVTDPDGRRRAARLDRTSLTDFQALVPARAEGVYAVNAAVRRGGETLFTDTTSAIRSYEAEYQAGNADVALLRRAVEAAGGRFNPRPEQVFDPAGLASGTSAIPLWPPLATLALTLAVIDVGLRRMRLERADLTRARTWLKERLGRFPRGSQAKKRAVDNRDRPSD